MKTLSLHTKLIAGALSLLALSSPAVADDILSVYRDALQNDASFAAARFGLEAGREQVVQARSQLLPTVGLAANANQIVGLYDPGHAEPLMGIRKRNYHGTNAELAVQASQPLYRPQNQVAVQQADSAVSLAELQYKAAGQQLMLRVAQAYLDVLQARDAVTTAAAQKEAFSEQLAQAKKRFQVGVATITDTYEAQSRFDLTSAQEIAARNELIVKTHALSQLTGKAPGWLASVSQSMKPELPAPPRLEAWLEKAAANNVALQMQIEQEKVARHEVERNKYAHKPTLDLVGSVSNSWDMNGMAKNGGTDSTRNAAIGLQLNLPLYTGGALGSKDREAVAKYEQARMQTEAKRREVEQATKSAYLGTTNGAAQVAALEQALVSSQSQLDATKTGQQVGVRTNVDVLNAQQQYYEARFNLQKARYGYLLASLNLAASAGELAETHLQSISRQLVDKQ